MVAVLLSVTFACGFFIAPTYDVAANRTAFGSAALASLLLGNWLPALLSAGAIGCWLILARRTIRARRSRRSN